MTKFGGVSGEKLRQIVAKIEKIEEEKREVAEALTDTYSEAKSLGFDAKILRKLVSIRRKDASKLAEEEEVLDLYMHAMGMIPGEDEKEAA